MFKGANSLSNDQPRSLVFNNNLGMMDNILASKLYRPGSVAISFMLNSTLLN